MPPRFSIIVPLLEHRGFATACLRSWTSQQDFPCQACEFLVVSPGADPVLEREAAALLPAGSRLLTETGANRSRLYDLGARAAAGAYVVFTESHCTPEPDCLAELDLYLRNHDIAGACLESVGRADTFFDRQDQAMFEEGFRIFRREGDWRKVNVHGFALRRDVYEAVGGLRHEYLGFAEMMLAAALRDGSFRLGHAEKARIIHHYQSTLSENAELVDFFVRGESLYRAAHPGPDTIGYSFIPDDLQGRPDRAARLWRTLASGLGGQMLGHPDLATWTSLFQASGRALAARMGLVQAACRQWLARTRCRISATDPERRAAAYRDWIACTARSSRWRFLAECRLPAPPRRSLQGVPIDQWPAHDVAGFHAVERWQGRPFRWSGPLAAVRLLVPPDAATICLETGRVRQEPDPLRLQVFLDGRPVPARQVAVQADHIRLAIAPGRHRQAKPVTLAWCCNPLRPWQRGIPDKRELGVPLFGVEFARLW